MKKTVFQHIIIFLLQKKEKLNAQIDIYPENHSFWPFQPHFGQFLGILGAPTGQLRAPLIFKNLVLTLNYIFSAKKKKIGCSLDVNPENQSFWPFQTHFRQFLGI